MDERNQNQMDTNDDTDTDWYMGTDETESEEELMTEEPKSEAGPSLQFYGEDTDNAESKPTNDPQNEPGLSETLRETED